jgi:uncharacterized membrane protein
MQATARRGAWRGYVLAGVLIVLAVALWPLLPGLIIGFRNTHIHAPNLALWSSLSPQVQMHVMAALIALSVGGVILARPKGRGLHKALGWGWVAAMAMTAITSLFITGLNGNSYSLIHLLSGWTIVALPLGILAIRRRDMMAHRRAMTGMFVGGLVVAGALTFLPGRFMFQLFFG